MSRSVLRRLPSALLFAFVPAACGGSRDADAGPQPHPPQVIEVYEALEAGLPDAARALLDQYGDSLGLDGTLLRARASLLQGDAVGALREVEAARKHSPEDARLLALEVEVLVTLDRVAPARAKLRQAWSAVGQVACLERSRGMLLLRTPGGAKEALAALEQALELDPYLLFVDFPLAQARLLVGREAMAQGDLPRALELVRLARAYDPHDPAFREFEAELRAARFEFEQALELYAGLAADGVELGDTRAILQQRYGTYLLTRGDRTEATQAYAAARALGLDDEGLGFGATVLAEESAACIDAGIASFEAGDLEPAADLFRAALGLDPDNLEARNHLAACLFTQGEYRAAAELWDAVLERAEEAGGPPPTPVHMHLARAWRGASEPERAAGVLARYLERHPEGPWVTETRELLAALEAERIMAEER